MRPSAPIQLILNDEQIVFDADPMLLVLDFLREHLRLTGTKEGCREGDCGSCTVMVGELRNNQVIYQPMPSCMTPMGELDRKHLVTVEGLRTARLSTVQASLSECHAIQCGFCTSGLVVAMTAWTLSESLCLDDDGLKHAVSGNLCRCTGYRSIKTAGRQIADRLGHHVSDANRVASLCDNSELPDYFRAIPSRLRELTERSSEPCEQPLLFAGGTDLCSESPETLSNRPVRFLRLETPRDPIRLIDGWFQVDARTSLETFLSEPRLQTTIPQLAEYKSLVASWPVRVRATLGGNLCNASPVADIACLLLALRAELTLTSAKGDRCLALDQFYIDHKKTSLAAGEWVSSIRFPQANAGTYVNWEKVSKRRTLDIASVNSAIRLEHHAGVIRKALVAMGGVARTPILLRKVSEYLHNKTISIDVAIEAARIAQSECDPTDDIRGSATYRRLLIRQLMLAHFIRGFPQQIDEAQVYAALR